MMIDLFDSETGLVTEHKVSVVEGAAGGVVLEAVNIDASGALLFERSAQHWYLVTLVCEGFGVTVHRSDWLQAKRMIGKAGDVTQPAEQVAVKAEGMSSAFTVYPAAEQRRIFGAVPFGKRKVRHITGKGFEVRVTVAFGQDYNDQSWSYAEIARLISLGSSVVGIKD